LYWLVQDAGPVTAPSAEQKLPQFPEMVVQDPACAWVHRLVQSPPPESSEQPA